MTNKEIDRRLALAIGYPADRVRSVHHDDSRVQVLNDDSRADFHGYWSIFDHTDPAVIWPIAERFAAFPKRQFNSSCEFIGWHGYAMCIGYGAHGNPATASALAVINYCEGRK